MKLSRLQGYTKPKNINKHYDRMQRRRKQDFYIRIIGAIGLGIGITLLYFLPHVSEWFTNNILNK